MRMRALTAIASNMGSSQQDAKSTAVQMEGELLSHSKHEVVRTREAHAKCREENRQGHKKDPGQVLNRTICGHEPRQVLPERREPSHDEPVGSCREQRDQKCPLRRG